MKFYHWRFGYGLFALCALVSLALVFLAGCCGNPGIFQKVGNSMSAVQSFYDPLLGQFLDDQTNDQARTAMVAADTALLLGGALQNQFCPQPGPVEQFTLQAQEAQNLAARAGVK